MNELWEYYNHNDNDLFLDCSFKTYWTYRLKLGIERFTDASKTLGLEGEK